MEAVALLLAPFYSFLPPAASDRSSHLESLNFVLLDDKLTNDKIVVPARWVPSPVIVCRIDRRYNYRYKPAAP